MIVIADRQRYPAAERIQVRFGGGDADYASRRVLAEQRALRASKYLDTFQLRHVCQSGSGARAVDAVDENTDGRLDAGVVGAVAEAADDEVRVAAGLQLGNAKRWHHGLQILDVAHLSAIKCLCCNNGNSDRRILQGLFAFGGRGDDFLDKERYFFVLLRNSQSRRSERKREHRRQAR